MKRIIYIAYGHVDVTLSLIKHLKSNYPKLQIDVLLVFAQNKKKESILNFEDVSTHHGFQTEETTKKILGPKIWGYIDNSFSINFFIYNNLKVKSVKNWLLSLKLIKKLSKYDIIHFSGQDATMFHLFPFISNKKIIFTIHDLKPHTGEGNKKINFLSKFICKRSNTLILQNKRDYSQMKTSSSKMVEYVPLGFLDIYRVFLNEEVSENSETSILFFGRISKYKGLDYFIDSLMDLHIKGISPKVIIAGKGEYDFGLAKLKQLPNVLFLNQHISNDKMVELIEKSKLVICPYTDATQSGVLFTTFAFNKPVIATNVGGFSDIVKHNVNGILIKPKNKDDISEAIMQVIKNPNQLTEFNKNIKEHKGIDDFKWDFITKKLFDLYNNPN